MDDSPIPNLDDIGFAELEGSRFYLLAQHRKNGHNGFPELVLHAKAPKVVLQDLVDHQTFSGTLIQHGYVEYDERPSGNSNGYFQGYFDV